MNILAIIIATFSNFLLGGLWYSPLLFGSLWQKEADLTLEGIQSQGNTPYIFAFIYSIASALGFYYLVMNSVSLSQNIMIAFVVGFLLVATSLGVNYKFAGRSNKLFFIDAGYHVARFMIYAIIFWYLQQA